MSPDRERDFGPQPIARILADHGLGTKELVAASGEQLTHKAVARAVRGRWLTPNMQEKLRRALERATGERYDLEELFTYAGGDATGD